MLAVSLPLLLGAFLLHSATPRLDSTRSPIYADANLLLPLSRLPNRKKRIGNLCFYVLATTKSAALGAFLRGHGKGKERKQGCCPLISKIFSLLVTALSSSRTVQTYCCTFEHRTEGRPLQSTTSQMSWPLGHSQRRQGTGRRGQQLHQAVGPILVTLTASTRKVNTPEYTQMTLPE